MLAQEEHHRETFAAMVVDRRVRPTALLPLWHLAGYALGAASALIGERGAMACTVAVEEAIRRALRPAGPPRWRRTSPGLRATIEQFRAEELEHRDIGLANEAELAPAYALMSRGDQAGLARWRSR